MMKRRIVHLSVPVVVLVLLFLSFDKNDRNLSAEKEFIIDTLATDLVVPWEIVFLPDETMLFTERSGTVRIYRNEKLLKTPALEIGNIETKKKMGLLGLAVHPDFPAKNYIYLAYNYSESEKSYLRVVRYNFKDDALITPKVIIEGIEANQNHTGSRVLFGPKGYLYITTGDADHAALAQDLKRLNGKILRLNDDGSIPEDNPFVKVDTARGEIWSYGHRNTQGLAFQPGTGLLFNSEHGPSGGDEINIIEKAGNYGWPVIHHKQSKYGMRSPFLEYTPSIAPSKIIFYNSDIFPQLKGDLLLATLRGENIYQLHIEGGQVKQKKLFKDKEYGRIRAITVGPDGFLYFSTSQVDPPEGTPGDSDDLLLRIRPGKKIINHKFDVVLKTNVVEESPHNNQNVYEQLCLSCHGANLEGTERGPNLIDDKWIHGNTRSTIARIIGNGAINKGMPAWNGVLSDQEIKELSDYIIDFN